MFFVLAQSQSEWSAFTKLLVALGVIVAVALLGFAAAVMIRRRLADTPVTRAPGFTLSELRRMRDEGQISPDEFERARAKMVETTRKSLEEPTEPPKEPRREPKMNIDPGD